MFDRSLLNPMRSGNSLYDALLFFFFFYESIRNNDESIYLVIKYLQL